MFWNSDKIFFKFVVEGVRLDFLVVNYFFFFDYKLIIFLWLVIVLVFERRNEINLVLMIVIKENILGIFRCSWGKRGYLFFSRGYYFEKVKIIIKIIGVIKMYFLIENLMDLLKFSVFVGGICFG